MSAFTGQWNFHSQTNFIELLNNIGVDNQKAKLVASSKPILTIKVSPDQKSFKFKHLLPKTNQIIADNTWYFGQSQEDVDENGNKGVTCWELIDENCMIGKFDNEGNEYSTVLDRRVEGDVLTQRIIIGENVGVRVFCREK